MLKHFAKLLTKRSQHQTAQTIQKEYMHQASNAYFCSPSKPVWSGKNYMDFAENGYSRNVIAHRAVNMLARAASSVALRLQKIVDDAKYPILNHSIINLCKKPNPLQGSKEFFENLYSSYLISGNAYIMAAEVSDSDSSSQYEMPTASSSQYNTSQQKHSAYPQHHQHNLAHNHNSAITSTKNATEAAKYPKEMYLLRSDRVQILTGDSFMPIGYRYNVNSKYTDYFIDELSGKSQILHIKSYNPVSDWYGLSPLEVATFSIDQHNQASAWNQALLQNGGRPSGAIMVKNSDGQSCRLSAEQIEHMKNMFAESFSGAANAGKPLLLEGGLEWREMSLSPKDMDYIESKNSSAREIALAIGVPPQLLGISGDNTYSNLAEARVAMWEQTVLPLVENVTNQLSNWFNHYNMQENIELIADFSDVGALECRTDSAWERLSKNAFMTINEKRQHIGLPPLPNGDVVA